MQIVKEQLVIETIGVDDKLEHVIDGLDDVTLSFTTIRIGIYTIYVDWHSRNEEKQPTIFCRLWPELAKTCRFPELIKAELGQENANWRLKITRTNCSIVEGCFVHFIDDKGRLQRKLSLSLATPETVERFANRFLGSYVREMGQELIDLAIEIHTQEGMELMD